jgi:DNA helicase INO80
VLITSYQFVVSDQKYFQKVRWQYMLLDEAHAIKSSSTARWKTLLNFKCRNRLLLTGTPIQNSMQELWALLHFIMPTMFDSHEEFSEWFSKDIESHASDKGKLNERQLNRLHMILKPFMLRRVKSEVQHEIGSKIEKTVYCELSARQKRMYSALADRISVDDLLDRAIFTDQTGTRGVSDNALLNAVMQLRKVCNHPQIFEPAEVVSPFTFAECASAPLSTDEVALLVLFNSRNPINYRQPRLLSELPHHRSKAFLDIWDPSHCLHSDGFSFANLSPYSLGDFSDISGSNLLNRVQIYCRMRDGGMIESEECNNPITAALQVEFFYDFLRNSPFLAAYSPKAVSPPVELDEGEVLQIFDNQLDKFDGVDFRSYNQSRIFIPTAEQLIFDCGKLGALDNLLEQLKLDNHRVLLYFQMTKVCVVFVNQH